MPYPHVHVQGYATDQYEQLHIRTQSVIVSHWKEHSGWFELLKAFECLELKCKLKGLKGALWPYEMALIWPSAAVAFPLSFEQKHPLGEEKNFILGVKFAPFSIKINPAFYTQKTRRIV